MKQYRMHLGRLENKMAYLVSREEKYIRVVVKGIIGSIPMVHIKINDKHALQSMCTLSIASSNSHITEDTESHGSCRNSMMTWWPY